MLRQLRLVWGLFMALQWAWISCNLSVAYVTARAFVKEDTKKYKSIWSLVAEPDSQRSERERQCSLREVADSPCSVAWYEITLCIC